MDYLGNIPEQCCNGDNTGVLASRVGSTTKSSPQIGNWLTRKPLDIKAYLPQRSGI